MGVTETEVHILDRHVSANGYSLPNDEEQQQTDKVREVVVPQNGGCNADKRSEVYVDGQGIKSEVLRLDPCEKEDVAHVSAYRCPESPTETKLQVASTMPSGKIDLILDEQREDSLTDTPGTLLERLNSAPGLSCLDPRSDNFADSTRRIAKERSHRISRRKRKKLMKRLGSIVDGALEIDEADENLMVISELYDEYEDDQTHITAKEKKVPPLQIAMLIVGTRGDVQPFVAIGKELQKHGHRVRLATHANFKEFVKTAGLEYYQLGGDPKVLAEYMVKNKGFLPSGPKEIKVQRKQLKSIMYSLYPACIAPDQDTGVPFNAQAIISNPPAYGHVHVAEALGVPLHIYFTMPWTPTSAYPHPLSRLKSPAAYRLSYRVVDITIWLGIRSLVNDLRKKKLKLRPVSYLGRNSGSISNLPTCYMWSQCLVPKPKDWGPLVDVVGYCFLELADDYKPPEELVKWLHSGSAPIYIGFGSLPVENPEKMRDVILEALKQTGQRGLIDKGWGGIGKMEDPPAYVRFIQNCPHDWLFPLCSAVVHHGGAGTTAAGLKAACPTTVVPFFGDQPFWGERVHDRGIGPLPIPVNHFSLPKLVDAINFMLSPEVKQRAVEMAACIAEENGVVNAVKAFYKQLPEKMPREPRPAQKHPKLRVFNQLCCY